MIDLSKFQKSSLDRLDTVIREFLHRKLGTIDEGTLSNASARFSILTNLITSPVKLLMRTIFGEHIAQDFFRVNNGNLSATAHWASSLGALVLFGVISFTLVSVPLLCLAGLLLVSGLTIGKLTSNEAITNAILFVPVVGFVGVLMAVESAAVIAHEGYQRALVAGYHATEAMCSWSTPPSVAATQSRPEPIPVEPETHLSYVDWLKSLVSISHPSHQRHQV